jgi:hypothetical protein
MTAAPAPAGWVGSGARGEGAPVAGEARPAPGPGLPPAGAEVRALAPGLPSAAARPADSANPAGPANPADSANLAGSADSANPANSANPADSANLAGSADSANPANPAGSANVAAPLEVQENGPGCGPDLWSLLAEADAVLPAGRAFVVLARPRLAALCGNRPALGRDVIWRRPGGAVVPPGAAPAGREVRLWIEAAPERAADAAVLRDGVARGAAALGWTAAGAASAAAANLLVSLGRAAPAAWGAEVERGAALLRDGAGDLAPCTSLVATRCCGLFPRTLCPVEGAGEPAGQAVWRDGAGRTVLAREAHGAGTVLRFAGRFAPAAAGWSRGAFVALLREIFGDAAAGDVETSIGQALPRRAAGSRGGPGLPLALPLWLVAGCLFAAERWLAGRRAPAAPVLPEELD